MLRCRQSCKHNWMLSPRWWHGGMLKAPMEHGIPPNHAKHHCRIRIFGLVIVLVHPHQGCYTTLADVACKLMLLMDGSTKWVWAFIQLNEVLSHAPLSSMGHISTMTDGAPSMDPCSQLHQLQVCKLLQCKDMVVWPEGLNGQKEASQFTFKELPLWDTAAPGEPIHKLQLIALDLSAMQAEGITTTIQTLKLYTSPTSLQQTLLSLLMTALQQSTCSSQAPWCDCCRLCPLPQPLFPSTAHQGISHHLQIWGLCQQPKNWKIPSGQRGQTPLPLSQWQPSHWLSQLWCRHLNRCPFQLVPPALSMSLPEYFNWLSKTIADGELPFYHTVSGPH